MAQKLWRVVRACVELGPKNPIQQIHDQGAGGNCNVVRPCIFRSSQECKLHHICSRPASCQGMASHCNSSAQQV